jgi:hypothetical protein
MAAKMFLKPIGLKHWVQQTAVPLSYLPEQNTSRDFIANIIANGIEERTASPLIPSVDLLGFIFYQAAFPC